MFNNELKPQILATLRQDSGTTRKFLLGLMRYWGVTSPAALDKALKELRQEGKVISIRDPESLRTSQLWFLIGEQNGSCS